MEDILGCRGFPPWVSALDLALFHNHNDAVRLLLAARAQLAGGIQPGMVYAAAADNAEGIRLLCGHGGDCRAHHLFGYTALDLAAALGSKGALEELLAQSSWSGRELSFALQCGVMNRGGTAEIVERLVMMRADVDFEYDPRRCLFRLGRLFMASKSLQHSLGRATELTANAYHIYGMTPLMGALQSAEHEAAASLIAKGARLDVKNRRGWMAKDFAGASIPIWLQKGLLGDPRECARVTSLALHVQITL